MKHAAVLALLVMVFGQAQAAEPAGPVSKADCDATLTAEVERLETGFAKTKDAWQKTVDSRFAEHAPELTPAQMQTARANFDQLVLKVSNQHVKAVALPGIYRMMLAVPQYDLAVCSNPKEMRALGDQAIVEFLRLLAELLPHIEKTVDAAKAGN